MVAVVEELIQVRHQEQITRRHLDNGQADEAAFL